MFSFLHVYNYPSSIHEATCAFPSSEPQKVEVKLNHCL